MKIKRRGEERAENVSKNRKMSFTAGGLGEAGPEDPLRLLAPGTGRLAGLEQ